MSFQLISAILQGQWFLSEKWADAHLAYVKDLLAGNTRVVSSGREKSGFSTLVDEVGKQYYYDGSHSTPGSVLVLEMRGPIMKYDGECGEPGSIALSNLINMAVLDRNISGIVLDIDSPGGTGSGATYLVDTIKKAVAVKPVISYIRSGGAYSAAYWIAAPSTEIWASGNQDGFGSIGGFYSIVDYTKHLEKEGIEIKTIYSRLSPEKNQATRELFENKNEEPLKDSIDFLVGQFHEDVRAGRGDRLKSDKWEKGGEFFYPEAKQIGLVDDAGDFQTVIERARQLATIRGTATTNTNNFSNKNKNSSMSKTTLSLTMLAAALAWTDGYETDKDGAISLSKEESETLESFLADSAKETETLTTKLADLQAKLDAQATANEALQTKCDTQKTDLEKAEQEKQALTTKVETLEAMAAPITTVTADGDAKTDKAAELVHPTTAEAERLYSAYNAKA